MRKQTKLVAVLSAAALLALGASMTSFAAGWEKDEAGVWHFYDEDDELVTGEWKKDGGKWFYLDDDGDMLTDAWVDDEYYVGEDGAMLINSWIKTYADEDQDDPEDDGEHWYFFGSKGKKVTGDTKKINGKTYLFDEDGEMQYGWQYDSTNEEAYYYGDEDDGARTENQWLWLERSGLLDDDDDEQDKALGCVEDGDMCDDEGWYWFQSSGKAYHASAKKKINGKYYMFNDHGQMLYEWINTDAHQKLGSNAQLDGKEGNAKTATIGEMVYYNAVEDGSRGKGWIELDGSKDVGTENDTNWYFIDNGEAVHASNVIGGDDYATNDDDGPVFVYSKKIKDSGNKYFAFDEKGKMLDGLQYVKARGGFYYFDENGYQQTGKVSAVECDDDDYAFYFNTTNGKNGLGYTGEKDGYLYYNGKRLEADDDYRFYYVDGNIYLVNTKGKIQKATNEKKYDDIENKGFAGKEDIIVKTNKNGVVEYIENAKWDAASWIEYINFSDDAVTKDQEISVPYIALYDSIYTYNEPESTVNDDGNEVNASAPKASGWR